MMTTFRYRLKDSGSTAKKLLKMSGSVNSVWNYCKQTQKDALKNKTVKLIKDKKSEKVISIPYFLSTYEMNNLVSGSSKERKTTTDRS